MTSNDDQDKELLERYRRASDAQAAAPSAAVRAAILAEGRRAAEQHATGARDRPFDSTQPAANDSRWKITAFGTAGAALVAALLFAPRLWENAPVPSENRVTATASADKAGAASAQEAALPAAASSDSGAASADSLQEVVVTQAARKASKARTPADSPDSQHPKLEALARQQAPPAPLVAQDGRLAANAPAAPASPLGGAVVGGYAARAGSASQPQQSTALQSAAAAGDVVQATALLDQGAGLNERDPLGRTPLMLAVVQSRPDIVQLLLDRGADPNIGDSIGRTPLQQAKQANSREIAGMLERAGAR